MLRKVVAFVLMGGLILAGAACSPGDVAEDAAADLAEAVVEQAVGGDGDVEVDVDDEEVVVTDEDGTVTMSADDDELSMTFEGEDGNVTASLGDDLPADFPLPLPDRYEVRSSMQLDDEAGSSYSVVVAADADQYEPIKAMYEAWLDDEGFTVEVFEMENSDGTKGAFVSGMRDDVEAFISISQEEVSNDAAGNLVYETVASLTWGPAS